MPSIVPSYIYTLFATIIVGALIIGACSLSALSIRVEAEEQRLQSLARYVATECMTLITYAKVSNATARLSLNVPTFIGEKQYWIKLANGFAAAWVEVGFGTYIQQGLYVFHIPAEVAASGTYISGSGPAVLECRIASDSVYLTLTGGL
ncbi:MAG: hypothetical protein N3E52_05150 [Candidatus Bathyarchaeota archaeon]|nr:hypothetical protein [Candidatus Bathyarchaeota archaeon]